MKEENIHENLQVVKKSSVPAIPMVLNTPTGNVMVWGHEHVSRKLLEVLGVVLTHDAFDNVVYHGIKSVVFRTDGFPKENGKSICASFAPDVCGVAINMEKTLERTIDRSMDNPETSLLASWWIEMLLNFGHEVHHGVQWDSHRLDLCNHEDKRKEEEELADKYSESLIEDLVKEYDIEPPSSPAEETWLHSQLLELFDGKSDEWAANQKEMLDNGVMWQHTPKDGEPVTIHSFKDLICLISKGDIESDEWNKPTITIKSGVKTLDEQLNGKIITTSVDLPLEPAPCDTRHTAECEIEYMVEPEYAEPAPRGPRDNNTNEYANVFIPTPAQNFNFDSVLKDDTVPYAGIQHSAATISRVAKQVYMKMYTFIFTNCLPQKDNDVGFSNPEAVCSIALPLTTEESSIFISMNHLDINGRWCTNVPTTNGLLGKVMKNTKLPAYEVTLMVNGITHRRLFLPQNPAKRSEVGQLTQRALEARAGNAIGYIMNPDDNTKNKYKMTVVNGAYEVSKTRT